MATISDSTPHVVRTAKDPRQRGLHRVTVSKVEQVNSSVRLIQLQLPSTGVGPSNLLSCRVIVALRLLTNLPGDDFSASSHLNWPSYAFPSRPLVLKLIAAE